MQYFTFPMETLNVTQTYFGSTSHYPHTTGNPKDYPIDVAGIDGGQSAVFARVPLRVVAKRGVYNSEVTNTVWLQTVDQVITPTFTDYAWMTLTHWNDNDSAMKQWDVGNIIPEGNIICYEGTNGVTYNHIHLVCGRGECSTWIQNSNGKWVMDGESLPPEQVLYIDPSFTTTIKNTGGLAWRDLPKYIGNPVSRDINKNQVEVLVSKLNVREEASVTSRSLGYINLGIYDYDETYQDDQYTWYHIPVGWIADNGSYLIVYPMQSEEECNLEVARLQAENKRLQEEIKRLEELLQPGDLSSLYTFIPDKDGYYYLKLNQSEVLLYKVLTEEKEE